MTHRRLLVSSFPMSTIVLVRCHAGLISLCATVDIPAGELFFMPCHAAGFLEIDLGTLIDVFHLTASATHHGQPARYLLLQTG